MNLDQEDRIINSSKDRLNLLIRMQEKTHRFLLLIAQLITFFGVFLTSWIALDGKINMVGLITMGVILIFILFDHVKKEREFDRKEHLLTSLR